MSWRYANGNRAVSDGKLLFYEKANHQLYRTTLEKSQYPGALSFVMERSDFKQDSSLPNLTRRSCSSPAATPFALSRASRRRRMSAWSSTSTARRSGCDGC